MSAGNHYGDNHYGDRTHYGDEVKIYGGTNVSGIVKHQTHDLPTALQELRRLVEALRDQVGPAEAQALDADLQVAVSGGDTPEQRYRALAALTAAAAAVGEVGRPVMEVVQQVRTLLGG
ncbi:hypothetical protein ACWD04_02340 [Streptomyces sp. NPDC002911]